MKRTAFFLIPTVYTSSGKLPMDYRLTERKIDRRTRFWKINKTRETTASVAAATAEMTGMQIFRGESGKVCRILAPTGKAALAFRCTMESFGWRDKA